ncbi:hypothetical protein DERF_000354 [Dermatophagoides farinae]|uniref:Uncharacterized protein n=1 Tax=Dermatophagoides farinae TaxID=6954 RepID=A0A922L8K1_DERFA|nr:hypothetical protein DERF_000354 [Dermatophagoides farinae]
MESYHLTLIHHYGKIKSNNPMNGWMRNESKLKKKIKYWMLGCITCVSDKHRLVATSKRLGLDRYLFIRN